MDASTYERLSRSAKWSIDNLHDAYLEVGGNNPNQLAHRTRCRAIDEYRRERKRRLLFKELCQRSRSKQQDDEGQHVEKRRAQKQSALKDAAETIHEVINQLPTKLRIPAQLRWLKQRSPEQIANQLNCNRNTVHTWLTRAKAQLKADPRIQQVAEDFRLGDHNEL